MGIWHVFYADWQMECCGTPFSVGDEVSWPLLLGESGDWDDEVAEVVGEVAQVNGVRVLEDERGLTVALHEDPVDVVAPEDLGEERPGDRIRLAGLLTVERHGGEWPEVTGLVRAVRVVSQEYAETEPGSRTWEPVPGTRSLRAVDTCPKWFTDPEPPTAGRGRRESGALVTLEVPDR
ncbi:hypothetical protein STRCI_002481 [Streptomyces cinnabarinus]|uniref:Uncharacterized protein n=1 Tax=Streptomyces cinnabarinus TaxID=67287 RepID=A0ABY7KEF3_9ACTN|nr:DUF6578 domain-containing protein [Streptomyces cinnabarinus]WAZ21319.1 hypothetical protein STRCI_002481 [Streptomyces cinnabarinus]